MNLTDNTILITGGGSGIGRGLAEAFHELGNQVVIAGRTQKSLDEVTAANPGMKSVTLDVANPVDIKTFAARAIKEFPKLNVLFNNAGMMRNEDLLNGAEQKLEDAEATITTNLLGPIRLSIINVSVGAALYGSAFILPVYLAQSQGYNALQIGETVMWSGLPQLAIMPLVPLLMKRFDSRVLIGVGLLIFGVSCILNSHLDPNVGYDQLRFTQILRALGQPLVMVPLSALATAGIEAADAGSASGLFNMMRNLGGSIGIALLAAVVTQREHLHSNRLGELISLYNPLTRDRIDALTNNFVSHGFDLTTAGRMALAALDRTIRGQAYLGAYGDAFFLIGIALFAATTALFFTKSAPRVAGASAGAH